MSTLPDRDLPVVTGGVDTHKDIHVVAAIDALGRVLGVEAFPTTSRGYARLLAWLRSYGRLGRVGVEGTGTYGAGLARYLANREVEVVEVGQHPSVEGEEEVESMTP